MKFNPAKSAAAKIIYLFLGSIFLIIGILGVIMPIIPGFIFLLPAVICFAKGSNFFYNILRRSKKFGRYF